MEIAKCGTCGYLGLREGDGQLIEVDQHYRSEGKRDLPEYVVPRPFIQIPRCLQRVDMDFDMRVQAYWRADGHSDHELSYASKSLVLAKVLDFQIECSAWHRWVPGFSPKEHVTLDFQERVQASQERMEIARMAFDREVAERDSRSQRQVIWLTTIQAITAIVITIATMIALFQ